MIRQSKTGLWVPAEPKQLCMVRVNQGTGAGTTAGTGGAQQAAGGGGAAAWHPDDTLAAWEMYSLATDDDFTLDGTTGDIEVWANRGTADAEWRQASDANQPASATVGSHKAVDFGGSTSKSMRLRNKANSADVNRSAIIGAQAGTELIVARVTAFADFTGTANVHFRPAILSVGAGFWGTYVCNRTDAGNSKEAYLAARAATGDFGIRTPVLNQVQVYAKRLTPNDTAAKLNGSLDGSAFSEEDVDALLDTTVDMGRNVDSGVNGFTGQVLLYAATTSDIGSSALDDLIAKLMTYFGIS